MVPVEGSRKHVPGRKNQPQTIDPVRVVLPAVEADAYQAKGQRGSIALYQRMTPLVGQQAQKHRQRKKHGRQPARVPQAALCARAQRFLTHAISLPVVSRCTCRSVHGQRFCLRGHTPHSGRNFQFAYYTRIILSGQTAPVIAGPPATPARRTARPPTAPSGTTWPP